MNLGNPEVFDFPGFRVALAIASLPGMTPKLFNGFQEHHLSTMNNSKAESQLKNPGCVAPIDHILLIGREICAFNTLKRALNVVSIFPEGQIGAE